MGKQGDGESDPDPMVEEIPRRCTADCDQNDMPESLEPSAQIAAAGQLLEPGRLDRGSIPANLEVLSNLLQGLIFLGNAISYMTCRRTAQGFVG
jgi:hypothetical protein